MIIIGVQKEGIDFDDLWDKTRQQIADEDSSFFEQVTVQDAIGNMPKPSEDGCVDNMPPVTNYQRYLYHGAEKLYNHIKTKHSDVAVDRMKKVKTGENFTVLQEEIHSVHSGAYGRLAWDEPAPTITTRFDTPAGGRFIHPNENRTLTPREAARIQSFPDDFIFYGNKTSICKEIVNTK